MADTPDPDTTTAEDLDEDELRLDPLEAGMDPPEHWSPAMDHGTTSRETREGQDLGDRLAEEEPDTALAPEEPRDEIDRMDARGELEAGRPDDGLPFGRSDLPEARRGPSTDEAGESVARELRTPPEPE